MESMEHVPQIPGGWWLYGVTLHSFKVIKGWIHPIWEHRIDQPWPTSSFSSGWQAGSLLLGAELKQRHVHSAANYIYIIICWCRSLDLSSMVVASLICAKLKHQRVNLLVTRSPWRPLAAGQRWKTHLQIWDMFCTSTITFWMTSIRSQVSRNGRNGTGLDLFIFQKLWMIGWIVISHGIVWK